MTRKHANMLESFYPHLITGGDDVLFSPDEIMMLDAQRLATYDDQINQVIGARKQKFSQFLLFGVGGSSLGGQVIQASMHTRNVRFIENIDPHEMATLCESLDFSTVGIVVVSKSGYTPETVAQILTVEHLLTARKQQHILKDIVVLSMDTDTPLRRFAQKYQCSFIPHDPDIGGRYSIFSSTGAVVAAMVGADIREFRTGAVAMMNQKKMPAPEHFIAAIDAGVTNHVCLYYGDHLESLSKWYRQLWSESLGKDGKGVELSLARGVVDQHSQLQLYLDGPKTNYFTLFTTKPADVKLPAMVSDDPDLAFLSGKTIADLFYAEEQSTYQELCKAGLFVRRVELPTQTYAWGGLCAQLMLEVVTLAKKLGVDPFNQPAVESGKIRTREILRAH